MTVSPSLGVDEEALLALLNSTPTTRGEVVDLLEDPAYGQRVAIDLGGQGTEADIRQLSEVRGRLRDSVLTGVPHQGLDLVMSGIVQRPSLSSAGLTWTLDGPVEKLAAARAVIAWAHVTSQLPGRLRPCGNDECRLFLIDRSKGNTARWCSMAVCGNRMKARRHHARRRAEPSPDRS